MIILRQYDCPRLSPRPHPRPRSRPRLCPHKLAPTPALVFWVPSCKLWIKLTDFAEWQVEKRVALVYVHATCWFNRWLAKPPSPHAFLVFVRYVWLSLSDLCLTNFSMSIWIVCSAHNIRYLYWPVLIKCVSAGVKAVGEPGMIQSGLVHPGEFQDITVLQDPVHKAKVSSTRWSSMADALQFIMKVSYLFINFNGK